MPPTTPPETSLPKCLSFTELSAIGELVINMFDSEMDRIVNPESKATVLSFIYSFFYERRLYNMVILNNIVSLSETVFTNTEIRDFVLNLTDRFAVMTAVEENWISRIRETLVVGLSANKVDIVTTDTDDEYRAQENKKSQPYINHKVRQSIYVAQDTLRVVFRDNFWLVTLILIYMFLPNSVSFSPMRLTGNTAADRHQ